MANKMTKKDYFAQLRAIPAVSADPALVAFIDHEVELLSRKNTAEKKPTAQQVANDGIKTAILDFLRAEPDRLVTVGEMLKEVPACADLTNQRVSALVNQLVKSELVERVEEKRKAYFRIKAEG